jgi:hypothetical protein
MAMLVVRTGIGTELIPMNRRGLNTDCVFRQALR